MKKITLTYILVITILFSFSLLSAQQGVNFGPDQAITEGGSRIYSTFDRNNDIFAEGSQYLNETFSPANISAIPDKVFEVRYNAFDDEIEIKIEDNNIQYFNKNMVGVLITMLSDDSMFTSINYFDQNNVVKTGYLISLTESNKKVKLFSKKQIKYFAAKPAKTSYQNDKPAVFKNIDDTYYVSINNGYARELPSNKKDITKLFPKNASDVLNFIKKNKIKTSREADLIKLINYVNTL